MSFHQSLPIRVKMPLHPVITDWVCPLGAIALRSLLAEHVVLYRTRWAPVRLSAVAVALIVLLTIVVIF